jgi:hypothetical protein
MTTVVFRAALAGILVLFVACSDGDQFTGPTVSGPLATPAPSPTPSPPTPPQPPLSGSTTTYTFSGPLSFPISSWTERSSFVLYESGSFSMQYDMPRSNPYLGTYQRDGNRITFMFSDWPSDRGTAMGALTQGGNLLEVRFSLWMGLADFEDAVYKWVK